MQYPKWIEKANHCLGIISGMLIFLIAILSAIEVVARNVFDSPTTFTSDVSYYLLIWAIFLTGGYAFQETAHVRVDLILNLMPVKVRKLVSALSYVISIFFCSILLIYGWKFMAQCYTMNRLTYAMLPILQWKLVLAIVIGCALMILTLIFIILDVIAGGKKYL